MRIIHVSNFPLRAKGVFLHGVAYKISNGLIRNGHQVLNFSDRDMARAHSLLHNRKWGVGPANRVLRRYCNDVRPDLLLFGHADVIRPATIAEIRHDLPDLRVLQWNVDPMFEPDNVRRLSSKLDVVDATLVSTAGEALRPLARPGKRVGFLPNPVDRSIETARNHERGVLPVDLICPVGGAAAPRHIAGEDISTDAIAARVAQERPELRCVFPGSQLQGWAIGHAYQAAFETAAMGLNLSRRNDVYLYSSDRLAHMAGNGLAVLVDRATRYTELFDESQMAFFSTLGEMVEKAAHLAAHPAERMAVAAAGWSRYHQLFNEQLIAKYVIDVAFDQMDPRDYEWPTLLGEA
jgi:hypothetical protein